MKMNIGNFDRILRVIVGLALIYWVAVMGGPAWAWFGVVPLMTSVFRFCPVYPLLGVNTCGAEK